MADKIILAEKGYNIAVESWENDADNYRTCQILGLSLDELKKIHLICEELFIDINNSTTGIGNADRTPREKREVSKRINAFIEKYPQLNLTEDYLENLSHNLCSYSEHYAFRVYDSMKIFYSPEDIVFEELNIKKL